MPTASPRGSVQPRLSALCSKGSASTLSPPWWPPVAVGSSLSTAPDTGGGCTPHCPVEEGQVLAVVLGDWTASRPGGLRPLSPLASAVWPALHDRQQSDSRERKEDVAHWLEAIRVPLGAGWGRGGGEAAHGGERRAPFPGEKQRHAGKARAQSRCPHAVTLWEERPRSWGNCPRGPEPFGDFPLLRGQAELLPTAHEDGRV